MAQRLNKKVALIGSAIFVFVVLAALGVMLYLSRNPDKFIEDGDAAVAAKDYKAAIYNYTKAASLVKDDSLRVELLFKLADAYHETNAWRDVLGCWNGIIRLDEGNVKARLARLDYVYIMADSGVSGAWPEVLTQATDFLDNASDESLAEEAAKWETYAGMGAKPREAAGTKIGAYLYFVRGRANLEIGRMGGVTDPGKSLDAAMADLGKVIELEPANVDAYYFLAEAHVAKGEIAAARGMTGERDKAAAKAKELLQQGIDANKDNPRGHLNLLRAQYLLAPAQNKEQLESLEPGYMAVVKQFGQNAEAFAELAGYYTRFGVLKIDKAVEAIEKAVELDRNNISYRILYADVLYRRYSQTAVEADREKAMEIAKGAFALEGTRDGAGPLDSANRMNRASLYIFTANSCIEKAMSLDSKDKSKEPQRQQLIAQAEESVRQVEQIFGSGEDPQVIKWRGMLDLAKGDREAAIRKLYAAYEQIESSGRSDGQLSYVLAETVKGGTEIGAVVQFLTSALNANIAYTKPKAHLDYAEAILALNAFDAVIQNVDSYDENFGADYRSKMIRTRAYIGANLFDDAEKSLAASEFNEVDKMKLSLAMARSKVIRTQMDIAQRAASQDAVTGTQDANIASDESLRQELAKNAETLSQLAEKLLTAKPDEKVVEDEIFSLIGHNYLTAGDTAKAREIFRRFQQLLPENAAVLYYAAMFSENEPAKLSAQRRKEIEEKSLTGLSDSVIRAINLGRFYQRYNEPAKAVEQYRKVFNPDSPGTAPKADAAGEIVDARRAAASYLFDIAAAGKDWQTAEKIATIARTENLDRCEGLFFAARLAAAQEKYEQALLNLGECIKQNPLFSYAYMLRSTVNGSLGNEDASIVDARKATMLNPGDGNIAKILANALYARDERLGIQATNEQLLETRSALERAIVLNQRDPALISFYAQYISEGEPMRALAIRQSLHRSSPTLENAVMLGMLATELASKEADSKRKEALFQIAGSSLEQAKQMDPADRRMLYTYAEYYRARGMEQQARGILEQSQDKKLLWSHYYQSGQIDKAGEVLQTLYKETPADTEVLKGLLLLSEQKADQQGVQKYAQELLKVEETVENYLLQIQLFLKVGLLKEADSKLQSFTEKYPGETRAVLFESLLATKQGKLQKALDLANRALTVEATNPAAWQLRGEINLLMANYNQAIIDLAKSRSYLDEPAVRIALAKAYSRARRDDDAITELRSVIDDPQVFVEARMLLEQIYRQPNRKDSLKNFYAEMLTKTDNDIFWSNKAGNFAMQEKDFAGAEKIFGQAWENSRKTGKGDPEAFNGYLQALLAAGNLDKVLSDAGKYVDSEAGFVAFTNMAEAKLKSGDKTAAVDYCRKAVEKTKGMGDVESWALQRMYFLLGPEEVSGYCNEKLRQEPGSFAANFTMYNLAMISGEYNNAFNYLDKCIEIIGPADPRIVDYSIRKVDSLQLAYNKTSDKNYIKKAIAEYESLMSKMPNSISVFNNLAYMLAENDERLADAMEYSKRAYDSMPNSPAFMETYSYVLYKNGKYTEALEMIQASLQQYQAQRIDVPVDVYEHLGMINEKLGSKTEALAAYEQALKMINAAESKPAADRIKAAIERLLK